MNSMTMTEERLRAFVDGELDAADAAQVEAALAHDEAARRFVERERALRAQLQAAFAPVLDEPVPDRLMAALRAPAAHSVPTASAVVDLGAERERRRPPTSPAPRRVGWPTWLGLAASVLLAVFVGLRLQAGGAGASHDAPAAVVADASLSHALATRRAADNAAANTVQVGISFVAKDGHYCRSFALPAQQQAGLACQRGGEWQVQVLAHAQTGAAGAYRQAATVLPPAVLQAVDAQIDGAPLDASAEEAAIRRGWRR